MSDMAATRIAKTIMEKHPDIESYGDIVWYVDEYFAQNPDENSARDGATMELLAWLEDSQA